MLETYNCIPYLTNTEKTKMGYSNIYYFVIITSLILVKIWITLLYIRLLIHCYLFIVENLDITETYTVVVFFDPYETSASSVAKFKIITSAQQS